MRRIKASFAAHEAILAGLSAGDGVAAAEWARAQVLVQSERFMALLAVLQAEAEALAPVAARAGFQYEDPSSVRNAHPWLSRIERRARVKPVDAKSAKKSVFDFKDLRALGRGLHFRRESA
ncbi:hypothetical protein [Xanthobacter autotrophicus]|uniref:hypothetical protein n=1 Tax=Xanthobacter autotrophicus TaxID=280 RepID=UPI003726BCBD